MTPRAVLFDCDGVLVDSEELTNQLLRDDLAAHGLDIPVKDVQSLFIGGTMEGAMQESVRLGADLPPDWVAQFYAKMFAHLEDRVEAVEGIPALLDHLVAKGVKLAVGSNGPYAKMQITLGRTGLIDIFNGHVYSARDRGQPKPAPDIYLYAAQSLGVPAQHCVVVEDSASGAKAAQAAGMRCIGYAAEGQAETLAPHCGVVARTMQDVAQALGLQL